MFGIRYIYLNLVPTPKQSTWLHYLRKPWEIFKLLYTEISSGLLIHSKLTHQQHEWIKKQIKTPQAYISVEKS